MIFTQWLGPQRLTNESGRSETTWPSNAHCIACDGKGKVYVVYTRDAWTDSSEIYIKISTDYGVTWQPELRITDAVNDRCYPSIALDTLNRVHVVWMDRRDGLGWQVYYKRSTDGGVNWDNDIRISQDDDYSQSPCVATDGADEVYIVWYDSVGFFNHDVFFRKSTDGGVSWGPEMRISTGLTVEDYPAIAYEPVGKIHIAWDDFRNNGQYDIYYRRSTDRGNTWGPETNLTPDTLGQVECSIAASPNYVYLSWSDARNSQPLEPDVEVYYKNSTNSGSSWSVDTRVTYIEDEPHWPNITTDIFNGIHIVYQAGSEIYYLYSSDRGATWSDTLNISSNSAVSMHPFVAVDLFVHIVWSDNRDGNFEIYYNRTSQPIGIQEFIPRRENSGLLIYPNPFSQTTKAKFQIPNPKSWNSLKIYDATGRLIRQWDNETMRQGDEIVWSGDDDSGRKVPAGVYFVRLEAGDNTQTEKVILLR